MYFLQSIVSCLKAFHLMLADSGYTSQYALFISLSLFIVTYVPLLVVFYVNKNIAVGICEYTDSSLLKHELGHFLHQFLTKEMIYSLY